MGLGKKKEVIKEKMIRLRKEGSLLDGARVPRFPSFIYMAPSQSFPFKAFLIGNLVRKITLFDHFKGFLKASLQGFS